LKKKPKKIKKARKIDIKGLIFGQSNYGDKQAYDVRSTQVILPIQDINRGVIITGDNRYIKVLELLPVNFYLKSRIEQQNIIYYYSSYLKIAPANLQIIVTTQRADIDAYCENMEHFYEGEENENCKCMILENAELVNYLASSEAVTRRFFLAFEYEDIGGGKATFEDITRKLNDDAETAARLYRNRGDSESPLSGYSKDHQQAKEQLKDIKVMRLNRSETRCG